MKLNFVALVRHGDENIRVRYDRLAGKESGGTWEYSFGLACLCSNLIKPRVLVVEKVISSWSIW